MPTASDMVTIRTECDRYELLLWISRAKNGDHIVLNGNTYAIKGDNLVVETEQEVEVEFEWSDYATERDEY